MSRQVGSLHRSISNPANLQSNLFIIPFFASPHLNQLMIKLHPACIRILIQTPLYISHFPKLITPISRPPTNSTNPNPAIYIFPISLSTSPLPNEIWTPFPSLFYFQCNTHMFPLTTEPSDNNSSVKTQISRELDNFITLQQQLQHPQTLTIHKLSQPIISSNPSTSTPSSNHTPSQGPTSSSTPSSSTNWAYRTFKRKFPTTPFHLLYWRH